MKTILISSFFAAFSLFAELPSSKVDDLKAKRDKAIENINQIYKQELRKLLADPSLGKDTIAYINDELNEKDDIVDFREFVGKTWLTQARSEFMFTDDKRGYFKNTTSVVHFEWKKKGDIVVATSLDEKQTWWLIFNKDSVYFGLSPTRITEPLILGDK